MWIQKELKLTNRYDVLFDIEIFDKIKFQEKILSSFDFKEIICNYIDQNDDQLKKNIIQLITEKLILDPKIDYETMSFYASAIFYCIFQLNIKLKFEEFNQYPICNCIKSVRISF